MGVGRRMIPMKEPFEPTLPGNPNQFTIRQHIFPRFAIERFTKGDVVRIWEKGRKPVDRGPEAGIFVTRRKWDQCTEEWLGIIDTEYAALVAKYSAVTGNLDPKDNAALTRFYASWVARWKFGQEDNGPVVLHGIPPDNLTKEVQEQAEKIGVVTSQNVGGKCAVPSRFIHGDQLLMWLEHIQRERADTQWRCCEADKMASLLVPDVIQIPYVPFSPFRFFVGFPFSDNHSFCPPTGAELNRIVMNCHKRYYFGSP